MKLLNKKYIEFKGNVYDLEVESNDHSYVIEDIVVHNSAAGSLISYLTDITQVDPIRWNLLFERFLNKGRLGKVINENKIILEFENGESKELGENDFINIERDFKKLNILAKELKINDILI